MSKKNMIFLNEEEISKKILLKDKEGYKEVDFTSKSLAKALMIIYEQKRKNNLKGVTMKRQEIRVRYDDALTDADYEDKNEAVLSMVSHDLVHELLSGKYFVKDKKSLSNLAKIFYEIEANYTIFVKVNND